jgi:tRNA (adenine37-N6)-methyltransferase
MSRDECLEPLLVRDAGTSTKTQTPYATPVYPACVQTPIANITYTPIGLARTPFKYKEEAPRQGTAQGSAEGALELFPRTGIDDALDDLEGWERLIVLFHFDRAESFRPKVMPPRSTVKRGVLSTRSPHRPNPIGLTVVRLLRREGLWLYIADVDILDASPILDIKPYVPYADAFPNSKTGWLGDEGKTREQGESTDPVRSYPVVVEARAERQLAWLESQGVEIRIAVERILALGPKPHAYRRIRKEDDGTLTLAYKAWRIRFRSEHDVMRVLAVRSGYKAKQLALDESLALHRALEAIV